MSIIKQSEWAKGQEMTPYPESAGEVVNVLYEYTNTAGITAATDIVEIGFLPAGARLVDAVFIADETGAATYDVGLLSGDAGDAVSTTRDSGAEIFNDAADASATRMSLSTGFLITPVDYDRGIGVKASANVAAGATKIRLSVSYAC